MSNQSKTNVADILRQVDTALSRGAHPIAAFDADGTLCDTDLGEAFFQYQIENKVLPQLADRAWERYQELHDKDAEKAFLWLAQINSNTHIDTVRRWAKDAVDAMSPLPFFSEMKSLIHGLQQRNVEVYVVTASVEWAVEPGAELLGIPRENVIGVKTKIKNDLVTTEQDGPISWREGKVLRLLAETKQKKPMLAAGNTMGDFALISCATDIKIANCWAKPDNRIFETERKLVSFAKENHWHCFTYEI